MASAFESVVLSELRALGSAADRIEQQLRIFSESKEDVHDVPRRLSRSSWSKTSPAVEIDIIPGDDMFSPRSLCSSPLPVGERVRIKPPQAQPDVMALGCVDRVVSELSAASYQSEGNFVASTLPLGWPGALKMRNAEVFQEESLTPATPNRYSMRQAETMTETHSKVDVGTNSCLAIDPNSKVYLVYSLLSLAILAYDLTLLPYLLAWDVELKGFLYVSAWVTPMFWTVDIGVNFLSGFYEGGALILDVRRIGRAYCRSWFTPDLAVVLCDWTSLLLGLMLNADDGRSLKMLRFSKLGRMLRIIGMMRMLRVVRIMEDLSAMYLNEFYRLVFKLVSLLTGILWLAHLMACLWFAIGVNGPSDTGRRWVDFVVVSPADSSRQDFLDLGGFYQYTSSFHWAAAMIALGNTDIIPTSSIERIVYVLGTMFGFLFGSTLVSTLSAAMMDYQMMQKDKTMKLRTLRRYLQENEVSPVLAVPVQRQVEQRLAYRESIAEGDVAALQLLSVALRSQLRFEIQRPHLSRSPLFRLWTGLDGTLMHRTCMKAVNFASLRPKDDLFHPGDVATVATTLVRGEITYTQRPDSAPVAADTTVAVEVGSWLCEAALWVEWTHVGSAEARSACDLLTVEAEELSLCLQQDYVIKGIAAEYCRQFHKRVSSACPPQSPYPNDLQVPYTDYCDLVVSMPKSIQLTVGREALLHFPASRSARSLEKLREEVECSKSIVVVTGDGAIVRVVSLVVLRATTPDGRICMQVAKYDGTELKSAFQLPGLKQEANELVADTLQRLFSTKLTRLSGQVEVQGTERQNMEKESKEYGVQTRYMRSICAARLRHDVSLSDRKCDWEQPEALVAEQVSTLRSMQAAGGQAQFDVSQRQLLKALCEVDVYAIGGAESGNLYAWLPPDTESSLGTPGGDKVLQHWISGLRLPSVPAERSEALDECMLGFETPPLLQQV